MSTWLEIAGVVASNAAFTGLVSWGLKAWAQHGFERLKSDHDHALGKLRADHDHALEKLADEHRVRFTMLHERRFEVVADVYAALTRADRALLLPGSPMWLGDEDHRSNLKKFEEAGNAFREKFTECRIFFPPVVGDKFDAFWKKMMAAGYAAADRANPKLEWYDRFAKASVEMAELKASIELECRRLLGELEAGQLDPRSP